jgi:hypothetical protein
MAICGVLGDIFVRRMVLFVEQNLSFQFQFVSAVAFAELALQKNVQNCSPMRLFQRIAVKCEEENLLRFSPPVEDATLQS